MRSIVCLSLLILCSGDAAAFEFLEKRDCTLTFPNRPGLHTTCLVKGGMQGGVIDVSVSTVDGKTYALAGPIDGEEGHQFLLQNKPAKKRSGNCYARNDGKLEICLESIVD